MAMLALKPPMGWNAWNQFGPAWINETVVRETADAMVEKGLRDAGYTMVSVDDCWMTLERDENGDLQADPVKFPSGMKALGDYLHERGLQFGLYAGAGVLTYAGRAGSYGYERRDARKFAEWGVDLLKYDFGYVAPGTEAPELYKRMGQALRECGRVIIFSGCYGINTSHEWMRSCGAHMWRLRGDITDQWDSIVDSAKTAMPLGAFSGPCGWNDPDMMVVGLDGDGWASGKGWMSEEDRCRGCTVNEYGAHFALWCMLSAPLLMGHDVRQSKPEIEKILLNRELIAINQDDLAVPAYTLPPMSNHDIILAKPLYGGDIAFLLLNETDSPKKMILSWECCGWEISDRIKVRDVTEHTELGEFTTGLYSYVEPHSAKVFRAARL